MKSFQKICIHSESTLQGALERMDVIGRKLLIVMNGDFFLSVLSIGDIQRAIIAKVDLTAKVSSIVRDNFKVASTSDDISDIKQHMLLRRNEFMPIVSSSHELVDVVFWEDLFGEKKLKEHENIGLPVVIMAGGKGSRLKPITNVLPKPLIPIGEKTILEEIMDRFVAYGCQHFYLSVNYKAKLIKHFIDNIEHKNYQVDYFQEETPLGTAGSMYLLKGKISSTFFVSNCDIVIDQSLAEIYRYHKEQKNSITIVSALKSFKMPYGTIETREGGQLWSLDEKPQMSFQINSGMYLLEPEMLDLIPDNTFFHITELIKKVQKRGDNIGVFPVSEGSWKDIGDWSEYLKHINVKR